MLCSELPCLHMHWTSNRYCPLGVRKRLKSKKCSVAKPKVLKFLLSPLPDLLYLIVVPTDLVRSLQISL